jgi:hypothetical protein
MRNAYDRNGNFKVADYIATDKASSAVALAELQAMVDKFGPETVLEIQRMSNPAFVMPEGIVTERKAVKK